MEFLSEFIFKIKHIKGKENQVADALSTRNQLMRITTTSSWKMDLKSILLEAFNVFMSIIWKSRQPYSQLMQHWNIFFMNCKKMEFFHSKIKYMYPIKIIWRKRLCKRFIMSLMQAILAIRKPLQLLIRIIIGHE